jgi:hypothetical protein
MMHDHPTGDFVAGARVSAAGAFVGAAPGFATVLLAANVFTLTLDRPIDTDAAQLKVTSEGAVEFSIAQTSDTVLEVRGLNNAGAAAAGAFSVLVTRKAVG